MIEIQHRAMPTPALTQYRTANPAATAADFDSTAFKAVKDAVKADLHQDQGGLCVYCEQHLKSTEGQVEHIKPKAGANAHPHLCFDYHNYAHSCINNQTCGQRKGNGLLPIEPGPGCNQQWAIANSNGWIEPLPTLTRRQRHPVVQTRDMLGLNKDPNLVSERKKWFTQAVTVLKTAPDDIDQFLQLAPFRALIAASI
ncbi:TIGR02646 family protein [Pectobacterium brasiliense]|uniref:retron system putative HNH endonuclease n=1 Tax=Pectobacterium TaxID=122277 RepID=UPI0019696365|nr:retron system putative HNH endonuclease [Pectobacterium brasiliense]MBN3043366.1 TIGR02646 family protein [Pectobacterium brasiliense]